MKLIIILAFFTGVAYTVHVKDDEFLPSSIFGFSSDAVIQQLIEMLRHVIKNGCPDNGVPVLDPFIVNGHYHKSSDILSVGTNITNGFLTELGSFRILKSEFNKEQLSLELRAVFPFLLFQADYYEMKGKIYNVLPIPISGRGKLYFQINNLEMQSKIFLKQSEDGKSILIEKLQNSRFQVESFQSKTTFDDNIDDIVNAVIQDVLADYVNRFSNAIVAAYTEPFVEILNSYLKNFESWRIIAVILDSN